MSVLLKVDNLKTWFKMDRGVVKAVDGVSYHIDEREVIFEEHDLLKFQAHGEEIRSIRGGKISMIFQEPMTSLNPVLTIVGQQLTETLELHLNMDKPAASKRATELLKLVGIPECSPVVPPLRNIGGGHEVSCIRV